MGPPTHMWPISQWTPAATATPGAGETWDNRLPPASNAVPTIPPPVTPTKWNTGSPRDRTSPDRKKRSKKKKEKEKPVEDTKTLDLDTRIAMLLKGKGSGGMAPPFLQLGGGSDSEDDLKMHNTYGASTAAPIAANLDSEDGIVFLYKLYIQFR